MQLISRQNRISENLRCLRAVFGYTQSDIARAIHICRSTYVQYETGRSAVPVGFLLQLAGFYHVSIDLLLEGDWQSFAGRLIHTDPVKTRLSCPLLIFRYLTETQQQTLTSTAALMLRQENRL